MSCENSDYTVRAGDTLSFEVGSSLIDAANPIDVDWSCRVGIKKQNAATFLTDRAETATNADDTKYVVTFTTVETDITEGQYLIVVQMRNDVIGFLKTVVKTLEVTKKLFS